jgi:hypothetical protein
VGSLDLRFYAGAESQRPDPKIEAVEGAGMVAKHLGIVSAAGPQARFIHAYTGHGVVENALTEPWARRIVGRFEFPKGA